MQYNYPKELFLKDDTLITSKTDLRGKITYGNEDFIRFVGYTQEEFLYKPHSIIRHPFMPKAAFKLLWDTIKSGEEFFAFVCNLAKNGSTYWVFTNVTPSYNDKNKIVGYYSVRRRASKAGVEAMIGVYSQLLDIEKTKGMDASVQFVLDFLQQNQISWDKLIISLQAKGETEGYR